MSYPLYLVRDVATGFFINKERGGHSGDLFVQGIENAFAWDELKPAHSLSASLSHSGRVCEVVEMQASEGSQQ